MKQRFSIILSGYGKTIHVFRDMNDVELNWYIHYQHAMGFAIDIQVME